MPRKILAGKKIAPSHTSIIEVAVKPVQSALALECVSKVVLGIITPLGNGSFSMKFMDIGPGCLLVKIRGPRSMQEIRIYTSHKESTTDAMVSVLK